MRQNDAPPTSRNPGRSNRSAVPSVSGGTSLSASANSTTPMGTFSRNIHGQLANDRIQPPTGGPRIGATSAGQMVYATAFMSCAFVEARITISLPTGTIMEPPSPCNTRDAVNIPSVWLTPQSADATVKMRMAEAKTRRSPKRVAVQPLSGMKIASVSRYAVMPTFTATADVPKLRAMVGRPVAMMVASRFSMNSAPAASRATASACPRSVEGSCCRASSKAS